MNFKVTRGKENIFYLGITILFVLLLVFFLSSKSFMYDDEPVMQTPFSTEITGLDQTKVLLESWEYNPEKELMEVILQLKHSGTDPIKPTFSFRAKQKQVAEMLPIEVVFMEKDLYVIHIKKVPKEYSVVGLYVKENRDAKLLKNQNESSDINVEDSKEIVITGDYRKVKTNDKLKKQDAFVYKAQVIETEIKQLENDISTIFDKDIPLLNDVIESLKNDITQLKDEKKYLTTNEKNTANSKIYSKRNEIQNAKKKQKELIEEAELLKEKIKKLEQKKMDVALGN